MSDKNTYDIIDLLDMYAKRKLTDSPYSVVLESKIYESIYDLVYSYVNALLSSNSIDTTEVVSDIMLGLLKSKNSIIELSSNSHNLKSYLYAIAKNSVRTKTRYYNSRKLNLSDFAFEEMLNNKKYLEQPKDIPDEQEKTLQMIAAKANLSQRQLEILNLRMKGFTNREIAIRLNISPATVGHYFSTLKKAIRQVLEK